MPRSIRTFIVLFALAVAAAACGTSSADPGSGSSTDPTDPASQVPSMPAETEPAEPTPGTELNACEIVTAADIAAALELEPGDVAEGELTESPTTLSPGHSECDFVGDWGGLAVSLTPEDGENLYDAARGSYDDASDREVTGSDGAFYSAGTKRGFFWKGAVTVMLQFTHLTVDADWDVATTAIGQAAMDKVD